MNYWIEGSVIVVYLLFLLGVGFVFSRFNKNVSDYFRSGAQGTWWLVGTSLFIASVSASTFTANAGVAYEAGWTVIGVQVGFWIGILINALFLARWFRQLRCITFPEVLRMRFGVPVEQLYSCTSLLFQWVFSAITLWSVATFTGTIFKLNIPMLILIIGGVVLIYSTSGGRWAVMATDFLQGIILVPMAVLMAVLALKAVGGMGELVDFMKDMGSQYSFVKPYGDHADLFPDNKYTGGWMVAAIVYGAAMSMQLGASVRYFSCKDGREAQRSAWWNLLLLIAGTLIFLIPPIVSRALYADQVMAMAISKKAEAAYAVACLNLLPAGLIGLMVTCMFAACMANIDTGLNANAAIYIQNIYPALRRCFNWRTKTDKQLVHMSRGVSIVCGCIIIATAMYFAVQQSFGMFEAMLNVMGMFGLPLVMPVMMALFTRKGPSWAPFVVIGISVLPGVVRLLAMSEVLPLPAWNYQWHILIVFVTGITSYLLCMPFHEREGEAFKGRVREFYRRMHTKVDFAGEVGEANDRSQLRIIGGFTACVGLFVLCIMAVPNSVAARLGVLAVGGFILAVGGAMWLAGRRK